MDGLEAAAKEIAATLKDDPALTVNELAAAHDLDQQEVVAVLDEYRVTDGKVEYAGPGMGGGWVESV